MAAVTITLTDIYAVEEEPSSNRSEWELEICCILIAAVTVLVADMRHRKSVRGRKYSSRYETSVVSIRS